MDEIRSRHRELTERYGDWTSHNIRLSDDFSTRGDAPAKAHRLRRVLQLATDLTCRPLAELRVLDLGCLEGQYAIEFALHGADVVAIEGREANIAKAAFARDALGLKRLELRHEDVRSLDVRTHGRFDVILCLGLLYHLDREDVFGFLRTLRDCCSGLLVLDTHIALRGRSTHREGGREYSGIEFVEHSEHAPADQRAADPWASLDNPRSFWPTLPSLVDALSHAGFSSALECRLPAEDRRRDRVTLVALTGSETELRSVPAGHSGPATENPEPPSRGYLRNQSRQYMLAKRLRLRLRTVRSRASR